MKTSTRIALLTVVLLVTGGLSLGFAAVRAEFQEEPLGASQQFALAQPQQDVPSEAEDDVDDDEAEEETTVAWDQLPEDVKAGFDRAVPGIQPDQVAREVEDGAVMYEAAYEINGKKHEVELGENGELLATEDTITTADLPAAVASALETRFPKSEVGEVVRITQTYYEIKVRKGGKNHEVSLLGNGERLEAED